MSPALTSIDCSLVQSGVDTAASHRSQNDCASPAKCYLSPWWCWFNFILLAEILISDRNGGYDYCRYGADIRGFFSVSVRACSSLSLGEEQLLATEKNCRQIKARQDNNWIQDYVCSLVFYLLNVIIGRPKPVWGILKIPGCRINSESLWYSVTNFPPAVHCLLLSFGYYTFTFPYPKLDHKIATPVISVY